jgi:hypothetical protein
VRIELKQIYFAIIYQEFEFFVFSYYILGQNTGINLYPGGFYHFLI